MTPMKVWTSFPLRFIVRYFKIIMRERIMDQIYAARLQGAEIPDPEWDDGRPHNSDQKDMNKKTEYEEMKEMHIRMKKDGTWEKRTQVDPDKGKIIIPKPAR